MYIEYELTPTCWKIKLFKNFDFSTSTNKNINDTPENKLINLKYWGLPSITSTSLHK